MKKQIEKPHLFFVIAIPIILLIGFLSHDKVLDVNFYDTYYIFKYLHLTFLISLLFGAIGSGYWIMQKTKRKLSTLLSWIHIVVTFGGSLIALMLSQFYSEEIIKYEFNNRLSLAITLLILTIVVAQLIFPINIIYALARKKAS